MRESDSPRLFLSYAPQLSRGQYPGFPGGTMVENPPANAGDATHVGPITGLASSPGGGHGNPLQYSWLENPMDRGVWWGYSPWGCRVGHNWATKHSTGLFLTQFYHCILYMGWKRALKLVFWFIYPWANAFEDDEDNCAYLRTLVIELGTQVWWDSRLSLWTG